MNKSNIFKSPIQNTYAVFLRDIFLFEYQRSIQVPFLLRANQMKKTCENHIDGFNLGPNTLKTAAMLHPEKPSLSELYTFFAIEKRCQKDKNILDKVIEDYEIYFPQKLRDLGTPLIPITHLKTSLIVSSIYFSPFYCDYSHGFYQTHETGVTIEPLLDEHSDTVFICFDHLGALLANIIYPNYKIIICHSIASISVLTEDVLIKNIFLFLPKSWHLNLNSEISALKNILLEAVCEFFLISPPKINTDVYSWLELYRSKGVESAKKSMISSVKEAITAKHLNKDSLNLLNDVYHEHDGIANKTAYNTRAPSLSDQNSQSSVLYRVKMQKTLKWLDEDNYDNPDSTSSNINSLDHLLIKMAFNLS